MIYGRRRWLGALVLFFAVIVLYQSTYSSVPTSDGYAWIAHINSGDYEKILPAYHALPMYLLFRLTRLLAGLGIPVATLTLIQAVNSVLAGLGAVLLYGTVGILGGGIASSVVGGCLLAVSFAYWYFANGELHHFSPVVLQLIFLLLVRARIKGRPYGYGFLVGLGLLNALAVLLHQENFLFGFAVVALIMVGRPWRQSLKEGVVYAAAGSFWTAVLALTISVHLRGVKSPGEFLRWFFWLFYATGPAPYTLGSPPAAALRALKGQLTAFVFGTQVVSDVAKEPILLGSGTAEWLLGATAAVYAIVILLLVGLWRERRSMEDPLAAACVGCVAWILSYKVFLHSWFWPTAPEYSVVTLPPLILILVLGPIAVKARSVHGGRHPRWPVAAPAALLILVAAVNLQAGILPWYRYGELRQLVAARLGPEAQPDGFFISSESGIDSVLFTEGNHLGVKDVFTRSSKEEGFAAIRNAIEDHLTPGRVFVYNLVPAPFTLLGMNHGGGRRGEAPLVAGDFEAFAVALERSYVFIPVLTYWEESRDPLYLFGRRTQVVWGLERKVVR